MLHDLELTTIATPSNCELVCRLRIHKPNRKFEETVLLPDDEELAEYPVTGWKQGYRPVPGQGPIQGSGLVTIPKRAVLADALNLELYQCASWSLTVDILSNIS